MEIRTCRWAAFLGSIWAPGIKSASAGGQHKDSRLLRLFILARFEDGIKCILLGGISLAGWTWIAPVLMWRRLIKVWEQGQVWIGIILLAVLKAQPVHHLFVFSKHFRTDRVVVDLVPITWGREHVQDGMSVHPRVPYTHRGIID